MNFTAWRGGALLQDMKEYSSKLRAQLLSEADKLF